MVEFWQEIYFRQYKMIYSKNSYALNFKQYKS